jgi:hypothetical protein
MSESIPNAPVWWGEFDLPLRQERAWQMGGFHLRLMRTDQELTVSWWREGEASPFTTRAGFSPSEPAPPHASIERFGFRSTPGRILLRPAAPDRPLVATPVHPFRLPPREEITLYVSVPLWVQLLAEDVVLVEEPLLPLSDTWFGPDTRSGMLCYASRTTARTSLANQSVVPHRAVSTVRIRNLAPGVLELEKLSLPTPNLSVHAGDDGHLWTEAVSLEREADGDLAALELGTAPPAAAGSTRLLTAARVAPGRRTPLLAFGRLLRRGGPNG